MTTPPIKPTATPVPPPCPTSSPCSDFELDALNLIASCLDFGPTPSRTPPSSPQCQEDDRNVITLQHGLSEVDSRVQALGHSLILDLA